MHTQIYMVLEVPQKVCPSIPSFSLSRASRRKVALPELARQGWIRVGELQIASRHRTVLTSSLFSAFAGLKDQGSVKLPTSEFPPVHICEGAAD